MLNIKPKDECRLDAAALGEILLRFDPGEFRISDTRSFTVWDGGAEYNVAACLSRVFGRRTAIITALADNEIGRLAANFARRANVAVDNIIWREHDGIGAATRNGLYFIDRGFGVRGPVSAFDRGHTAVSQLSAGDVDLEAVFNGGVRWFHTGGVFTGLSATTPEVAAEAMAAARQNGAVVSYDLNYRGSLWAKRGGIEAANEINRRLLPLADVVFGIFDLDTKLSRYSEDAVRTAGERMFNEFSNLKLAVSSLRETHNASHHDIGGVCFDGQNIYRSRDHCGVTVLDRVGSGDAFASAFIHGMLENESIETAINLAAAHGALAMTTPGDVSMATEAEVRALADGGDAAVKR